MKSGISWILPVVALAFAACKRGGDAPKAEVVEEPEASVVAEVSEAPEPPPAAAVPVTEPVAEPVAEPPVVVVPAEREMVAGEGARAPHALPVEEPPASAAPPETAGQKLDRAIDATRGGLGTAARKTGEGIETAAGKTGEALETAGEKTEEGLRKAGAATGRWLNRMGEKIEHAAGGGDDAAGETGETAE